MILNPIRTIALAGLLALPACAQMPEADPAAEMAAGIEAEVETEIEAEAGAGADTFAAGMVTGIDGQRIGEFDIVQGPHGILLTLSLEAGSLTPGWHGLHLHAVGDCSDVGTFKRSGGHVGMIAGGHGLLNPAGPEAGDLPNLWVAADGSAGAQMFSDLVDLETLLDADGSALLIHESRDDHISQPIGGAGARVGCGVVAVG